ncbi:metalloregulator ArsR/SmtB family transcription factor [Geotalea sp. SG265]|uniref:ArsR/SmtB family transcription factor n=1 Tax=Geotalea sp. SG265 TaxID=2922867 RepID=UPI001FAE7E16|nr:metalloregulator ArsR/SmtB family transcription factor [Geotalea sp. SG265]
MLETFKALADPCRLRLLAILGGGEFTVQELTAILGMGQSRISRHLKILTEAGVLAVKRQGTWSYYRVGDGNAFFSAIYPVFKEQADGLPHRAEDVAAVARVLEGRRRRSQEFFDRHARQWDELAQTLLPVPEYLPQLVRSVPSHAEVVEIGVGTGSLLPQLAAVASRVIGVDHSPAMLEEAGRRVAEAGLTGVELRLGEMTHLPIADGGAGCVVANMVLHHAADPVAVLQEIKRVLTAGGALLIADLARHERELAREQLADQWLGFEKHELCSWLEAAGFTAVTCRRLDGHAGQVAILLASASKK